MSDSNTGASIWAAWIAWARARLWHEPELYTEHGELITVDGVTPLLIKDKGRAS